MTPRLNLAKLPTDMFWKPTAFPADKPAENVFRLNARTDILPTLFPAKAAIRSQLPENRAENIAGCANVPQQTQPALGKFLTEPLTKKQILVCVTVKNTLPAALAQEPAERQRDMSAVSVTVHLI